MLLRRKNLKSLSPREIRLMKLLLRERRERRPQRKRLKRRMRMTPTYTTTTKSSRASIKFLLLLQALLMKSKRPLISWKARDRSSNKPENKKRRDSKLRDRPRLTESERRSPRRLNLETKRARRDLISREEIEATVDTEIMKIEVEEDQEVTVEVTVKRRRFPNNNLRKNLSDKRVETPAPSRWTPTISLKSSEI